MPGDVANWLRELLKAGPVSAREVKRHADEAGYPWRTTQRAMKRAGVESRETIYLPESDMVLLGARTTVDGRGLWLFYDCDKNAWRAVALKGDDPIGKGTITNVFHNSMGLMYDPVRKLVWAVGQNSQVHVLRLDLKTATVVDWKRTP